MFHLTHAFKHKGLRLSTFANTLANIGQPPLWPERAANLGVCTSWLDRFYGARPVWDTDPGSHRQARRAAGWEPQPEDAPCVVSDTRTCEILYVLADKYDDEHVIRTRPHFERAGYTTVVASNTLEEVRGFHESYDFTPAYPELLLEDVDVAEYDAVLFAGGDGVSIKLHEDAQAHRIAHEAMERGMVVAAAGDGPVTLAKAGLLEGRRVTVLYNVLMHGITDQCIKAIERRGAVYVDDSPVRDDRLVTASPVSVKFALGIIEVLQKQQGVLSLRRGVAGSGCPVRILPRASRPVSAVTVS